MAALKTLPTSTSSTPVFHIADPAGNHITLRQIGVMVRIGSPSIFVDLDQATVTDILPALTQFSATGRLS
jgi:hypothetical protein